MVQKIYRETRERGLDKKRLKNWQHRGNTKKARENIIKLLLEKIKILRRKGREEEALEIEERILKMKGTK